MLELIDVARSFDGTVALDGVTFSVEPGTMVGFVGRNGAGKTTAMRIVLGVLEADRGEVRWQGQPVDARARRRFGYMPEERGLYPKMRVHEQLVYFARLHGLERSDAARRARETVRAPRCRRRREDPRRDAVARQPAAGAARGRARAPARRAGARRALLRPRSGGRGRPGRHAAGRGRPRRAGAVLESPARARRAAVRRRRADRLRAGSSRRDRSRSCARRGAGGCTASRSPPTIAGGRSSRA